jgi:hypothetical protein
MKKSLFVLITLLSLSVLCMGASTLQVTGGKVQVTGGKIVMSSGAPTPRASFALDTAGGTGGAQVYDSIAAAWVGGGCTTGVNFSSGYLTGTGTTANCYIPGSYLQKNASYDGITIQFEWMATTLDYNTVYLSYADSGDTFNYYPNYWSQYYQVDMRHDYGSYSDLYYSSPAPSTSTWYTTTIQIDFVAQTIVETVSGVSLSGQTQSGFANIGDWGTLSANWLLVYIGSGTPSVSIRNLKIYNGIVTP